VILPKVFAKSKGKSFISSRSNIDEKFLNYPMIYPLYLESHTVPWNTAIKNSHKDVTMISHLENSSGAVPDKEMPKNTTWPRPVRWPISWECWIYIYRMGPPVELAFSCLKKWLNSMVYGRYTELVSMGLMNQHSHHWGAPSCTEHWEMFKKKRSMVDLTMSGIDRHR
jgi:hypothetical protein